VTGHHKWSEIRHKQRIPDYDSAERLHDELVFYIREATGVEESYWFIETYRQWRWKISHGSVRP
jgi:hypothetical protein